MAIEKTPNVPPFVSYCAQLIPTVFDNSLSYYEALSALAKWMQDNLVDVINNNAAVTEQYIQMTEELKTFVEDYFDNLDVQEEINNKLDAMVEDGTLIRILSEALKTGYVSHYGGIEGEDLTSVISSMINTYGLTHIFCDINGYLSPLTITSSDDITIDFMGHTIKFANQVATDVLFDNNGKLTLLNATFDGQSNNSITVLRTRNLSESTVNHCKFINFYEEDNTLQTHVITINSGSKANLTNLHFENIKQVGNGTVGDNGGAGSCILSQYDSSNPTSEPTLVNIDNILFKENYNVNQQGQYIVEDFDCIKLQNDTTSNDKHQFNVSNIVSINSGKRVIKIQTNNVCVNNIQCHADSGYEMLSIIGVFYKNHQISNIRGNIYQLSSPLELLECEDVNIDNVQVKTTSTTETFIKACVKLVKCKDCNLSNMAISGSSYGLVVYDTTSNISISNSYLQSAHRCILINTRTTADPNANNIFIDTVKLSNVVFKCANNTTSRTIEIQNPANTVNTIDNLSFTDCTFVFDSTTYKWGTIYDASLHSIFENCKFKMANTTDITAISKPAGDIVMNNCRLEFTDNTPKISIGASCRFYSTYLKTDGAINISNGGKAILLYPSYDSITGNTESNTILEEFDMS